MKEEKNKQKMEKGTSKNLVTEEVSQEQIIGQVRATNSMNNISKRDKASQVLNESLVGSFYDEKTISLLEGLRSEELISSFMVMPIGAPTTADFVPGRVKVLLDHEKKVIGFEME